MAFRVKIQFCPLLICMTLSTKELKLLSFVSVLFLNLVWLLLPSIFFLAHGTVLFSS